MTRSRRKNPFCGFTTARSEKGDKKVYNRRYRHIIKALLNQFYDDTILPARKLLCPIWKYSKDGKQRFDPDEHKELLRK